MGWRRLTGGMSRVWQRRLILSRDIWLELMRRPDVDPRDTQIAELTEANQELSVRLREANAELAQVRRASTAALSALRKQLLPLYRALQGVFGELDTINMDDEATPAPSSRTMTVWNVWKDKLGKGPAKAIDALLLYGPMTRKQIAVATGYSPQNVSYIISDLNKASLITKDGDRVTLRSL